MIGLFTVHNWSDIMYLKLYTEDNPTVSVMVILNKTIFGLS